MQNGQNQDNAKELIQQGQGTLYSTIIVSSRNLVVGVHTYSSIASVVNIYGDEGTNRLNNT